MILHSFPIKNFTSYWPKFTNVVNSKKHVRAKVCCCIVAQNTYIVIHLLYQMHIAAWIRSHGTKLVIPFSSDLYTRDAKMTQTL